MKYLLQVWLPDGVFASIPQDEKDKLDRDSLAYDTLLKDQGHFIAAEPLLGPETAVSIRHGNGEISITDGPFCETREHLGGFIVVEARDLNDAIRLASAVPVGRYGGIEVRPIFDLEALVASQTTAAD
ncbi:YciI family protein [Peteryoungia desertarenae]|uniref:YciI family protein n=1 Tax=Peteryoungia desertarenae TaxID=1813451 RepID=A0ABX6QNR2_9HYPH|nr:YciI family protein [Peteryoungia desertarenae]QLF69902.1 YciI family protein [Peteryoungia desertarenae]